MLRSVSLKTHHYLLILFFFTLIAYGPALGGQFIWDDKTLVLENPLLRGQVSLPQVFATELYPQTLTNYYRPLLTVSLYLDSLVFKGGPLGPHAVNIFLHYGVGVLLFLLLLRLTGDRGLSFFSSLLFLIHPVQTQVVAYVSGRADSLAAIFSLACLLCFLRRGEGRLKWDLLSYLFFVLALLSKEIALAIPFVLWVLDAIWFPPKDRLRRLAPFFVLLAVYAGLRASLLNFSAGNPFLSKMGFALVSAGLGARLLMLMKSLAIYLSAFFVPVGLHMERWIAHEQVTLLGAAGAVVGLALVLFIVFRRSQRLTHGKLFIFFLWWSVLWLLPQSALVLPYIMAEHFLYLPSMAIAVYLGAGLGSMPAGRLKRLIAGIGCAYLVVFTWVSIADWRNEDVFFRRTVALAPRSFRARDSLANIHLQGGRYDEAMAQYRKLIDPDGLCVGEDVQALGRFALQAKIDPRESKVVGSAFYNIGVILEKKAAAEEAYRAYRYALVFHPFLREAYNNLGLFCLRRERSVEAESFFRMAIRVDKEFVSSYNNLALLLFGQGKEDEAIGLWKAALAIDPSYEMARKNLEIALNEPVS